MHPLDPLAPAEIETAVSVLQEQRGDREQLRRRHT